MSGQGFNVYRVQYTLGMQDPMMGGATRYHNVLFVETQANGAGKIFHVTGDLVTGMSFEIKEGRKPEDSRTFYAKTLLGRIRVADYPDRLEQVLRAVPAPPRQRAFNVKTMQTEQIKPDGSFYAANEQRPPFMKCTEWTEQRAIPALHQYKLVHNNLIQASPPVTSAAAPAQTASNINAVAGATNLGWIWDDGHKRYRHWDGQTWIWQ